MSNNANSLNELYMTTGAAAAYLSVAMPTVRWYVKSGKLRGEKVGTFMLVLRADVERLARERRY